ncbi:phospholipid-transporting ATPase ABCA3-like isoform X2 [Littorina saxatilis]|uniref:phospholipid-transporting ATPase ABCA3-like isoform X2 n=1 Tax=Littorina saxatilis TaxID=31220 RepID=UPI0038B6017C
MGFGRQVVLVMYKNLLLKKSNIIVTILEIATPLAVAFCFYRLATSDRHSEQAKVAPPKDYTRVCDSYQPSTEPVSTAIWRQSRNTNILGFTPKTALTERLMSRFDRQSPTKPDAKYWNRMMGFSNMTALLDYYRTSNLTMMVAIGFNGLETATQLPLTADYHIRHDPNRPLTYPHGRLSPGHCVSDTIQYMMSKAFIEEWGGNSNFSLGLVELLRRARCLSLMLVDHRSYFHLLICISLVVNVFQSTTLIVYEKEQKLKETMKMMGLSSGALWTSWFLTIYLYHFIVMTILTLVFSMESNTPNKALLGDLSLSLFWVFLMLYSAATTSFCLMMGALLKKTSYAWVVACFLFFGTTIMNYFFDYWYIYHMTRWEKVAASLVFGHALGFGIIIISKHDQANVPLTWSKLTEPMDYEDTMSMMDVWLMLLVDTGIHLLVAWYLDNVAPGDFGLPKPFNFFLTKAHFFGHADSSGARHPDTEGVDRKFFESDPVGLAAGIRIVHLRKEFGPQVAVRDVSLKMYEGQITVLLGHNGAGKTTTMSMLTGFLPPTAGTAYVHGMDIRTDMPAIRQSLGLCPQHDVLFGSLTVQTNLSFFARLKGCPGSMVKAEVDTLLEEMGLAVKRSDLAATLSGGQKRKLSVAIALVYGSKVVILDEPSSGMDPQARRNLWHILQRQRTGRTMLLTTHYMDEADVLGDRIAIMAEGVVKCCGTSLFLKKRYGAGYHLVLVKAKGCNIPALTTGIRNKVPSARLEKDAGAEVTFLLPDNQSAQFPDLFAFLEQNKGELGITYFGASATTMEEVFLKVGESEEIAAPSSSTHIAVPEEGDQGEEVEEVFLKVGESEEIAAPSSSTHIAVPEEGDQREEKEVKEETTTVTSAPENGSSINPRPGEQPNNVNNDERSDVNQNSGDVNQGASDVKQKAFNVKLKARGVNQHASDVTMTTNDLKLKARGVNLKANDIVPTTSDVRLKASDANQNATAVVDVLALSRGYSRLSGLDLSLSQLRGMLVKKGICWWRSPATSLIQIMLPVVFAVLAYLGATQTLNVAGAKGSPPQDVNPPLKLNLDPFCETTVPYGVFDLPSRVTPPEIKTSLSSLSKLYAGQFGDGQHTAKEVGSFKDLCKLTVGFLPLDLSRKVIVGAAFMPGKKVSEVMATVLYNRFSTDARAIAFALVLNAVAKERVNSSVNIVPVLHPLPKKSVVRHVVFSKEQLTLITYESKGLMVCIILGLGMAFHSPLFIFSIMSERAAGSKHLQRVSGVSPLVYWTGNLLWDLAVCAPTFAVIIGLLCFTGLEPITGGSRPALVVVLFALYGPAMLSFAYLTHFFFKSALDATTILFFFNFASGVIMPGVGYVITDQTGTKKIMTNILDHVCSYLLPPYNLIAGLNRLFTNYVTLTSCELDNYKQSCLVSKGQCCKGFSKGCGRECVDFSENYWALEGGMGRYLLCLFVQGVVFLLLTLKFERQGLSRCDCMGGRHTEGYAAGYAAEEDEDVAEERRRIASSDVKELCKQDCVLVKVQRSMGYCPQIDPLIEHMTCEETLSMFGRLRGIPHSHLQECVTSFLNILELGSHGPKRAGNLSGGMKRKLSTAVSLIGDPSVILLDEPSAGLDPRAKHHLWDVLSSVRSGGRTLILTSHSMEECEALCTRVAIMVNGRMKCLGTTQHLKSRFGQGFTLSVKMGITQDDQLAPSEPLVAYVQSHFPSAKCFDSDQGYAHIQIPDPKTLMSDMFRALENAKDALNVEDYNVRQTSLEQVFLYFTSGQQQQH